MKDYSNYKPILLFQNGHIQSVVPSLFRKVEGVYYDRERIETSDDDFLDIDWSASGNKVLAVISHGLEGNSHRSYVKGMVKALNEVNVDSLAWNYRSCSGETNRKLGMYHNGNTDDLDFVIRHAIKKGYESIILIGFSMGANLSLLYLGEQATRLPHQVKGATVFSAPVDLKNSSEILASGSNIIYMKRFLKMLHQKVKEKMILYPDKINDNDFGQIKNFKDFDDRYTAPLHGFKDAYDYWSKCSSGPLLGLISVPTLIVNAKDDPFLGEACYPYNHANTNIILEVPKYGGHVGFIDKSINGQYWSETRAIQFINSLNLK